MHCTQCGTIVPANASYCAKCGAPLNHAISETPTVIGSSPTVKRPHTVWLIILAICCIGVYAAVLVPAIFGQKPPSQTAAGCMFWTGLFFWLWWKRRERKGWHGAVIGAVVGYLVFFSAAVIYYHSLASSAAR